MLKIALTCAFTIAFASAALAVKPAAEDASGLVLHSTLASVTGENSGITAPIPDVKPGDTFAISGDCVGRLQSADNLRVVLTLAEADAATTSGYRSVLATDQEIHAGLLHVRVPSMPEAANRVFLVKVFRLGQETPEICEAGTIRIGAAIQGKVG